jgi:formate dehydrogenase subunit gamma
MAGSPETSSGGAEPAVLRFGAGFRLLHWAHAIPFLLLLVTGLTLFVPPVKAAHVGGYRLVPLIHVIVGISFIISPLPLYLALRADAGALGDLRLLSRMRPEDADWARYALGAVLGARLQAPPVAKFNFGQKVNALFTAAVTAALMVSGAILAVNFFTKRVFSAAFVERVFPIHDLFMLVALPVVAVHIYLGSLNPSTRETFRGITNGRVRRSWARRHHPLWLDSLSRQDAPQSKEPDG